MSRSSDPDKRRRKQERRRLARLVDELRMHRTYRDGGLREQLAKQEEALKRGRRCTVCKGHGRVVVRVSTGDRPDELRTQLCATCKGSGQAEE